MSPHGLRVKYLHNGWPEKLTLQKADISIAKAVSQRDRKKCYKERFVLLYVNQIENPWFVLLRMREATLPSGRAV